MSIRYLLLCLFLAVAVSSWAAEDKLQLKPLQPKRPTSASSDLKRVTRRRGTASGKRHSDKMGGISALCGDGEGTSALENDVELPFDRQIASRCRVQSCGFGDIAALQPIPVYRNGYPSCAVPRNEFRPHRLSRGRTSLLCNCYQTTTVYPTLSVWDRELF